MKENVAYVNKLRRVGKFNREQRANLAHALMHLEANKILSDGGGGWYCGNKEQFIRRHLKAIAFVWSLLQAQQNEKSDRQ